MTAPEDDAADAVRIPNAAAARAAAAQTGHVVEPGADPAPAEPAITRQTPPVAAERAGGRQER